MQRTLFGGTALALVAAIGAAFPLSSAAATDTDALIAQVKALAQRVERLEAQNTQLRTALASDRISETEPELATRLKAVEAQQQAMKGPAGKLAEAFRWHQRRRQPDGHGAARQPQCAGRPDVGPQPRQLPGRLGRHLARR